MAAARAQPNGFAARLDRKMKQAIFLVMRSVRRLFELTGIAPPNWMLRAARSIHHKLTWWTWRREPALPLDFEVSPQLAAADRKHLQKLHGRRSDLPSQGAHLLVDLRVAQVNRERGIPRYAQSLVLELARLRPDISLSWLIEDGLPPLQEDQLKAVGRFVRVSDIPGLPRVTKFLSAGVFFASRNATALFPSELEVHQPALGAILFDFIPWIFPNDYLRDRRNRAVYLRAAETLPQLDRIFAISECSRVDAIAFGCAAQKVTTIYGGWGAARFAAIEASSETVLTKLPSRYWLYIGGDDPRKNIGRLLLAFAAARRRLDQDVSLVIVCSLSPLRRAELQAEAELDGLTAANIVFTGYLSDAAIEAAIRGAIATIFPSTYEGLGLPVLESYQCGRAALVSDTSSLRELAPPQCRFDPENVNSISDAIVAFHHDPDIERSSLSFAPQALEMCSWEKSAAAIGEWVDSPNPLAKNFAASLNVVSPLPPTESGVSIFTQKIFGQWADHVRIFVPGAAEDIARAKDSMRRFRHSRRVTSPMPSIEPVSHYAPDQSPTIWMLGNSDHHVETLNALARQGAPDDFIYLHETKVDGLLKSYHFAKMARRRLPKTLLNLDDLLGAVRPRNLLFNSDYAKSLVVGAPNAAKRKAHTLFHPVLDSLQIPSKRTNDVENRTVHVAHVGIVGPSKQPHVIVAACEEIRKSHPLTLTFAGYEVERFLMIHGLTREWIILHEAPDDQTFIDVMRAADVGVQLRWPQSGESSGAIFQWLSLRKPVIATLGGSFSEFDGAAYLMPPDAGPDRLAAAILAAAADGPPPGLEKFLAERSLDRWREALNSAIDSART